MRANTFKRGRYGWMTTVPELLYLFILLCVLGYLCTLPLRNVSVRHVFVFLGSVLFYCLALYRVFTVRFRLEAQLRLLILAFLLVLGVILSQNRTDLELYYSSLNFMSFYVIMTTDCSQGHSLRTMRWTYYAYLLIGVLLLIISRTSVAYLFEDGRNSGALALGMTNPNLTAMIICGVFNVLLINLFNMEKSRMALPLALMGGLLYLLWLTRARSSILTCGVVVAYALMSRKKRIPSVIVLLPMIVSIAFVPAYLGLYARLGGVELQLLGKVVFSGRQNTFWQHLSVLENVGYWLFGNLGEELFSNAHNAPLSILCSLGLVGLVTVYGGLAVHLIRLNQNADNPTKRLAVFYMMSVYVQSCAESLMFTGVFPSIAFMHIYLIYAQSEEQPFRLHEKDRRHLEGRDM